jgi:hypothetical protein
VSLTPEQRAHILYLSHVEGVSIVIIAEMTGLSRSAVRRVLHEARPQEVPGVGKTAALRPSSRGHIERQNHQLYARLLRSVGDAARPSLPRRHHHRRERTS